MTTTNTTPSTLTQKRDYRQGKCCVCGRIGFPMWYLKGVGSRCNACGQHPGVAVKQERRNNRPELVSADVVVTKAEVERLTQENDALRAELDRLAAAAEIGEPAVPTVVVPAKVESAAVAVTEPKALSTLMRRHAAGFNNFFVSGPAGSGKTTLAQLLAAKLNRPFAFLSLTGGVNETHLLGFIAYNFTTGERLWQSTDFIRIFEGGGVFLLDEVDAADANVLLAINAALANGVVSNPFSGKEHKRHADTIIVAAANTMGTGATAEFVGRNKLDGATLDRFVGAVIKVEFDRDLETRLAVVAGRRDAEVLTLVWSMRERMSAVKSTRNCGTRMVIAAAKLAAAGFNRAEMVEALTTGWKAEELRQAGLS